MSWVGIVVLAAGTYGLRLAGPLLRQRLRLSGTLERYLELAAVALLAALIATAALVAGHSFAGWARPAGVLVGAVLAWRKLPFVLVVIAAATVAATLRLAGVP